MRRFMSGLLGGMLAMLIVLALLFAAARLIFGPGWLDSLVTVRQVRATMNAQFLIQDASGNPLEGVLIELPCADAAGTTLATGYRGFWGVTCVDGEQCVATFSLAGYANVLLDLGPCPPSLPAVGYWLIVMQTGVIATPTCTATPAPTLTPIPNATGTRGSICATWTASPVPATPTATATATLLKPTETATLTRTSVPPTATISPTPLPVIICYTRIITECITVTAPTPTRDATNTPGPTMAPGGAQTPVPIIYKLFDEDGTDWQPILGIGVGSMFYGDWEHVNPARGIMNWSYIDRKLDVNAGLKVTLPNGQVIPKPGVIQVHISLSGGWNWNGFYDATPTWVYEDMIARGDPVRPATMNGRLVGHKLVAEGIEMAIPAYDSAYWRQCFYDMVTMLGDHYNNDPRITAVDICVGLDGESQAGKDWLGVSWNEVIMDQAGDVPYRYANWIYQTMEAYRLAFPTKPIYVLNGAGGGIMAGTADYATEFKPPIGIKNCGLGPDKEGAQGYGDYVGAFDKYAEYSGVLPIWFESAFVLGAEDSYWTFVHGLSYKPDAMDLLDMFFQGDVRPEDFQWVSRYLGKTISTTPDVWCVLRDWEFPKQTWGDGDGASGRMGDFTYWLVRKDIAGAVAPRVWREQIPNAPDSVYSRQCRRTDLANGNGAMAFDVADRYASGRAYIISVILLDHGMDYIGLQYRNILGQTVTTNKRKNNMGQWVTVTFLLEDAVFTNGLDGVDFKLVANNSDIYIHRVTVERVEAQGRMLKAR